MREEHTTNKRRLQLKILKEIVFSSNFALRFYYVGKGSPKRLQYEYESDTMV